MKDYCHIEDGVIEDGPRKLPRSWRNVSGLNLGTPEELKDKGWLPVRYVDESFDPTTQVRTGPVGCNVDDPVPPDADEVIGTYTVRDKTAQELDDEKDALAAIILNEPGLKAYALCINDGSIVPGGNMSLVELKAAVKAKL